MLDLSFECEVHLQGQGRYREAASVNLRRIGVLVVAVVESHS